MRRLYHKIFSRVKKLKFPKGKTAKFFLLLGAVFFTFTFFGGDFGFVRIWNLHQKKKELELEAKKLQVQILDLQVEKDKLKNDKSYLEKIAREKLGWSKKEKRFTGLFPSRKIRLQTAQINYSNEYFQKLGNRFKI